MQTARIVQCVQERLSASDPNKLQPRVCVQHQRCRDEAGHRTLLRVHCKPGHPCQLTAHIAVGAQRLVGMTMSSRASYKRLQHERIQRRTTHDCVPEGGTAKGTVRWKGCALRRGSQTGLLVPCWQALLGCLGLWLSCWSRPSPAQMVTLCAMLLGSDSANGRMVQGISC